MLKLIATLNLLLTGAGLGYIIYNQRRLIKKMNEQDTKLGQDLASLKANIGTIGTGINSLIESNAQVTQALADLKAANPDLSDDISVVEDLVQQTATMASNIEAAIKPVAESPALTGGGESGGDTSGGAGASGGSTSGEATGETGAGNTGEPGAGSGEVVAGDNVDSSVNVNSDTSGESTENKTEEFPQV